jgi:hypothetical protein
LTGFAHSWYCLTVYPQLGFGTVGSEGPKYFDDWTKTVRVDRVDASPDPDEATAQTIGIMSGHIRKGATDALVAAAASEALTQFGVLAFGLGGQDEQRRIAESCWWWCKNNIKFVHHESLLRRYLGEAGHLQGLIAPDILIRMDRPQGDCAIFTEMLCAMLRVAGVPYEIVTVAVNPSEPEIFSHVYPRAVLNDGRRLPLDASHGAYPGWQVPSSDVTRVQVWDESGNPIGDRGSRFDGLHNYGMRGLGAPGDCLGYAETGECLAYDTSTPVLPIPPTTGVQDYCAMFPGGCGPSAPIGGGPTVPAITAPSQNSAQWASFANALVKQGFTLAEINAIQPGTVVQANGAILRQNPGYAVGTPTSALNLGAGLSSSTLMLGGLALAGLFLVSNMGKR